MTIESILAVSAAVWGIAMGLSPVLQIRQMRHTGSSRDISVPYFMVLNIGFLLWLSYGLSMRNLAVAIPNLVAFTVGTATIAFVRRLRQPVEESSAKPSPSSPVAG